VSGHAQICEDDDDDEDEDADTNASQEKLVGL
jgi:hypothetical protein